MTRCGGGEKNLTIIQVDGLYCYVFRRPDKGVKGSTGEAGRRGEIDCGQQKKDKASAKRRTREENS